MSKQENKKTFGQALAAPFRYLIEKGRGMTLVKLILAWVLLLAAPYAYLWLCGVVFDLWLKWYSAYLFIFSTLFLFWAIDITAAILLTVGMAKGKKKKGGK